MLSLNVLTGKGCSTLLLCSTVDKQQLKPNRARYADQMLSRLSEVLPAGVRITLVADRGFADKKFFHFLEECLGFQSIICIKSNTTVTTKQGISRKATQWLEDSGRAKYMKEVSLC